MTEQTRKQYAAAWKAWKKASRIRRALADLTGNRNGPGKAWADECRVMLSRAERAHRGALRRQEEARSDEWLQASARIQVCAGFFGLPVFGSREEKRQQLLYGSSVSRLPNGNSTNRSKQP